MAEREKRLSPATLLGDGLLLVCAMAGLAVSFLSLYGGGRMAAVSAVSPSVLDLLARQMDEFIIAAVLFALLALAVWSLPRFQGAAVGGAAALWGLFLFFNWEAVLQGAGLTVHAITDLFSQWVDWGRVFEYDPGLSPAGERSAVRLFLLLALAGLAIALGWAVVRARRWWIVALLTLPPLMPGLLADLYPNWPAFMALCACWCAMLLTDLCKWAAADRRGVLTLTALPAVGLVLWGVTLLLPREGYTRPEWALRAEEALYTAGDDLSAFFSQWDGPFQSGAPSYVGSALDADLASAGPLGYTGRTVLRVSSDYDGRLYLWGSALGRYENGRWTELGQDVYQEYLDALEGAGLDGAPSPLLFPTSSVQYIYIDTVDELEHAVDELERSLNVIGAAHTATVERVRGSGVYVPYQLVGQDWAEAGITPVRDSYLAQRVGLRSYTVSFTPKSLGGMPSNMRAEQYYSSYVYRHYLDVPAGLEGTLEEVLFQYGQFLADPVSAASWVAGVLDGLCEYDPETPAAPAGADPVEYFLTESRRGYCMHFASAAVLMLREMGVPARYVSGYTAESQPGRRVDVPDYNAHAWVEVYVDGYGWYPVEVTPSAAFTWYGQGGEEPGPTPTMDAPESMEPTPTPTPTPPPSQGPDASEAPSAALPGDSEDAPQGGGIDFTPLIMIGKGLAAAAGVLALLWLGQYLPKRYRAKRLAGPDRNRAALDGYGYLRRLERWGGLVDGRAVELARKAKFSQHTLTGEELDEMRALVDGERARLCASPSLWKRLAARYLWGRPKAGKNVGNPPENGA